MSPDLDTLIRQRTGGAVNVRGVRFQILYTLSRALQAHAAGGAWTVAPEGLEDVDVTAGGITDHVQVKTAVPRWEPNKLKKALESIVGAARACHGDPTRTFTVLLSGPVNDGVVALSDRGSCPPNERAALDAHLAKLLRTAGAESALADALAPVLRLRILDEADLARDLRRGVVDAFGAHPDSAGPVVDALAAFVLDSAHCRRAFGGPELTRAFALVAEGQAVLQAFEAHGRRLVGPVDWTASAPASDFVDGRGTRAGHVAAGLDVVRPRWTARISEALAVSRLCVVRAPSGQRKSALALRYARDHWDADATLALQACESAEAAAQVTGYLRARADLGIPTCLLVDGADWHVQHWPEVAAAARDRGIPTLVTVRVEDWRRFASGSAADLSSVESLKATLGAGVVHAGADAHLDPAVASGPLADSDPVEPCLDLDEARELFRNLQVRGRIHTSVRSADEAFEQVGQPALLMEYLYLLTHGELLRHRLEGQLAVLRRNHDDDHLGALRLASFAHACGVPVPVDTLAGTFRADPQRVLSEIDGEYVRLDGGDVAELHRVRSEHLARLLHTSGPSPTATAERLLPLIPSDRLRPFVAGALRYPGLDPDAFQGALAEVAVERGPAAAAAVVDGLFEAGERYYAGAVHPVLTAALDLMGSPGPFFLSTLLSPAKDPSVLDDVIGLADSMANGSGDRLRAVRDLAADAPVVPRGEDRVRHFLAAALGRLPVEALLAAPRPAGRLLQEAHLVGVDVPAVARLLRALHPPEPDAVPGFAALSLGLYAHDPKGMQRWLKRHRSALGQAVARHLALVGPPRLTEGPAGPAVEVAFYPSDEDDAPPLNDQAVSRLQLLRELYPFAVHFRSRAHWLLPRELVPTHDASVKDMTPQYLRPQLFRDRQGFWNLLAREPFTPSTFWAYQDAWHELRSLAVRYAEAVERAVRAVVEGRPSVVELELSQDDLEDRLLAALRQPDGPPLHASHALSNALKQGTQAWKAPFDNVTQQIGAFARAKSSHTARLLRVNAYSVADKLPGMHEAFDALFGVSPDAFDTHALRDRERKAYADLAGAIGFWTDPPVRLPVQSLRKALRTDQVRRDTALARRAERALADAGVVPALRPTVLREGLDQTLVLALPLPHPCVGDPAVLADALSTIHALGDPSSTDGGPVTVWVTFSVSGSRFQPEGLRFFSHQLHRLVEDGHLNWESFAPLPLPPDVASALATLPVRVSPVYEAWKAALSALLLCAYVGGHLTADLQVHPQVHERVRVLRQRAVTGLQTHVDRVRALSATLPVPADAVDRLGSIAAAFASGDVLEDAALDLVADLVSASELLGSRSEGSGLEAR